MTLKKQQETVLVSKSGRKFLFDYAYPITYSKKPIIIFLHGFKGFKDWGHFNMMREWFCQQGVCFIKLNFSHNGTSIDHPTDFVDLEAFGNNNFSKELEDIDTLLEYLFHTDSELDSSEIDLKNITLVGHSKGGASALIKANEDARIHKVATLASVIDIKKRYAEQNHDQWKKEGVFYVYNGRTDQNMPIYYQLAEDVFTHQLRFDIQKLLIQFSKPALLIHPKQDETVPLSELNGVRNAHSSLVTIKEIDGNHTFDGYHPYTSCKLPESTLTALQEIYNFITNG